ncbi:unknown protein [Waddlia chondrophila 2032/99]|uniref:Uncharacterized protein n=1 Tax=Waddlia chondrophila 2032/99 TaxID=765953 RepID=F8LAK4_9BACT|nr:unknown protein [Waddlia chondrophila 2032/99]
MKVKITKKVKELQYPGKISIIGARFTALWKL